MLSGLSKASWTGAPPARSGPLSVSCDLLGMQWQVPLSVLTMWPKIDRRRGRACSRPQASSAADSDCGVRRIRIFNILAPLARCRPGPARTSCTQRRPGSFPAASGRFRNASLPLPESTLYANWHDSRARGATDIDRVIHAPACPSRHVPGRRSSKKHIQIEKQSFAECRLCGSMQSA